MDFILDKKDKLLWEEKTSFEEIKKLASKVIKNLKNCSPEPFCLWLEGDLGAGKTSLTKELFYELGLDRSVPVASPTYTYLLEYDINDKAYAHMDFYRFTKGSPFEENELLGHTDYAGFILEWPQNVLLPKAMNATHKLHIKYLSPHERSYSFYACKK